MKKVAIIGAGISGLFFANLLKQNSKYNFTIYEKNKFINLEKGYGVQLSVNSITLLNKIGFNNFNQQHLYNPKKIDFYSFLKSKKICDLDIKIFNSREINYTTIQRSSLIEFLRDKLPSNSIKYNNRIIKINNTNKNIEITFNNKKTAIYDYLIACDGIFSSTKSLLMQKEIKPKYSNLIAIRGLLDNKNLYGINKKNISLFLGPNLHCVVYPFNKNGDFNFIGILKKKLNLDELNNLFLFKDKKFLSSNLKYFTKINNKSILNNLKNIKCFPIFESNKIYYPNQDKVFLLGDALYAFPPTFAQGASQSIEAAYNLYEMFEKNSHEFIKKRSKKIRMINRRSKFNNFVFHLSNPLIIFVRDILMNYLLKNKKFLNAYLGKIYKKM